MHYTGVYYPGQSSGRGVAHLRLATPARESGTDIKSIVGSYLITAPSMPVDHGRLPCSRRSLPEQPIRVIHPIGVTPTRPYATTSLSSGTESRAIYVPDRVEAA